jgi:mannose-1-phosphate guanylyltransferase/phosphomannomutase
VLLEGTVIGDNCVVGEGSVIHPDVKLWPRKEVEPGTTVKESIIWGNQGRRALFGRFGVTGVVNVDLTPEFAAKLGIALGGTLPLGSYVAINRDIHRSSRMLKRALISGLPGAGINVLDLGSVAIPVARYFVRKREDTVAGIHVRLSPFDQRVVDIRFIDARGMNQSKAAERAVERSFFREDFRRAYMTEIGTIEYAAQSVDLYTEGFLAQVDINVIRKARFRVVIDFSYGLAADVLAGILNQVGVEVVTLNARMDETKLAMLHNDFRANLERVSKIVHVLDADLGMQFDVGGEKLFLVDENGTILDDRTAAALMVEMALFACPGRPVAVPVTLPSCFDTIADWHQSPLIRTGNSLNHLMHAADTNAPLLAADGAGSFIFPDFHPAVDSMMAAVRLLQYLAYRNLSMSQVVEYLPKSHVAAERVACPWEEKGRVMRCLHELYGAHAHEGIDGFRIYLGGSEWVFLGPDSEAPYFTVVAEADGDERAAELVREYCRRIEEILPEHSA